MNTRILTANLASVQGRPTKTVNIRNGNAGTKDTLNIMRRLTKEGRKNPKVRETALRLVSNVAQKNWYNEISSVHAYVRDCVRYVRDVRGVETIAQPEVTLEIGQGDCDDKAVLVASMLESIGHPTRFVAVGRGRGFAHVLVETLIGSQWIPVETTEPVALGWYPQSMPNRMVVHV